MSLQRLYRMVMTNGTGNKKNKVIGDDSPMTEKK